MKKIIIAVCVMFAACKKETSAEGILIVQNHNNAIQVGSVSFNGTPVGSGTGTFNVGQSGSVGVTTTGGHVLVTTHDKDGHTSQFWIDGSFTQNLTGGYLDIEIGQ